MHRRRTIHHRCKEEWFCENGDCKAIVKIEDNDLLAKITYCLNRVIGNPDMLYIPKNEICHRESDKQRIENEIGRALERSDFNKDDLRQKMLKLSSLKYDGISNAHYTAQHLKYIFTSTQPLTEFSNELTSKTVDRILLNKNAVITVVLKNQQEIREVGEGNGFTYSGDTAKDCQDTVERINTLRLPSIRSKVGEVKILSADDIKADIQKCGLAGSPTRVVETKENTSGRRKCEFISFDRLDEIIKNSLNKTKKKIQTTHTEKKISKVLSVTKAPIEYAKTVSDNIVFCDNNDVDAVIGAIKNENPDAVLFGSDSISKRVSALIAAKLDLGLCADCTALQTDGETLYMIRPALSGSVIAKIKSLTKPAMATVRTNKNSSDIVVSAGYGAKNCLEGIKAFADRYGAQLGASRKAVDNDILPYELQVGLTGKTVSPSVYIAIGISGAVHHIVGMDKAGTVIAINPDKEAPIFDYADYGIIENFHNISGGKK